MCALPLVHVSNAQSLAIEILQLISVRLCLGLPRYAPNIPTLLEGGMNLVENHGKELTLRHNARQTTCKSTGSLLNRLRSRPISRLGYLATEFEGLIDAPAMIYLAPPPYAQSLKINESFPMLKNKQLTAQVVARGLAEELIEESFSLAEGHPHVCPQSFLEPAPSFCIGFALRVPSLQRRFIVWTRESAQTAQALSFPKT
ncbi:hypothetical protein HPB47_024505 [Ixodes persulcatus]|uniref:Uncharacterized protein n=1 Tax=Ixodes persulcatus TaxID=34615 RepID=A0AC60Q4F1_IXOPE|nr:hypothetical protein HPB47_024505 [Ixodes persulcatus]